MLSLDPFTLKRIEAVMNGYIACKVPVPLRASVRLTYALREDGLLLTEERPASERYQWDKTDIARFEWDGAKWHVYAKDRHCDSWTPVDVIAPSRDFEAQLEQIELDRNGCFWPL